MDRWAMSTVSSALFSIASNTGRFTCPIDGLYFFSFTTLTISGQRGCTMLMRDTTELSVSIFNHDSNDAQSSASAVVECSTGNDVWLKSCWGGTLRLRIQSDNGDVADSAVSTAFSGTLIEPEIS